MHPFPSLAPAKDKLLARLNSSLTGLKANRRRQILISLAVLTISVFALFLVIFSRSQSNLKIDQPNVAQSPVNVKRETEYIHDPTVAQIENQIKLLDQQIQQLDILNHPLLLPSLDMDVSLK